jgi:hypothetical protein
MWWRSLLVVCGLMGGCTTIDRSVLNLAESLNKAKIANCTTIKVAVPPYGTAVIYAKAGDVNCMRLWEDYLRMGP